MTLIKIKRKLNKSFLGRILFKAYHYLYAIPKSKIALIRFFFIKNSIYMKRLKSIKFLTDDQVFLELLNNKKSLCRYGDGEITWICRNSKGYFGQDNSIELSERLKQVLGTHNERIIVGIPNFFNSMSNYSKIRKNNRNVHLSKYAKIWDKLLNSNYYYADSLISRVYFGRYNTDHESMFDKWKKIWNSKKVVVIEGETTMFGVGNDLLSNAYSVERIIAPAENAFSKYLEIFEAAMRLNIDRLVLVALGPTATILAYDLALKGYQCIDIGHLDIEYEWFINKIDIDKKTPVKGKYVNEAGGMPTSSFDEITYNKYLNEIIYRYKS